MGVGLGAEEACVAVGLGAGVRVAGGDGTGGRVANGAEGGVAVGVGTKVGDGSAVETAVPVGATVVFAVGAGPGLVGGAAGAVAVTVEAAVSVAVGAGGGCVGGVLPEQATVAAIRAQIAITMAGREPAVLMQGSILITPQRALAYPFSQPERVRVEGTQQTGSARWPPARRIRVVSAGPSGHPQGRSRLQPLDGLRTPPGPAEHA